MIFQHKPKKEAQVPGIITLTQSKVDSSLVLQREEHAGSIEISSDMLSLASRSSSYISEDGDPSSTSHPEAKWQSLSQEKRPSLEVIKEIEEEEKKNNDTGLMSQSHSRRHLNATAPDSDEGKKQQQESGEKNRLSEEKKPKAAAESGFPSNFKAQPSGCDYLLICCNRTCGTNSGATRVAPEEFNSDLLFKDQIYKLSIKPAPKNSEKGVRVLPSDRLTDKDLLEYLNEEKDPPTSNFGEASQDSPATRKAKKKCLLF